MTSLLNHACKINDIQTSAVVIFIPLIYQCQRVQYPVCAHTAQQNNICYCYMTLCKLIKSAIQSCYKIEYLNLQSQHTQLFLLETFKALNGLLCADVPLRNYSLTHLQSKQCFCTSFCEERNCCLLSNRRYKHFYLLEPATSADSLDVYAHTDQTSQQDECRQLMDRSSNHNDWSTRQNESTAAHHPLLQLQCKIHINKLTMHNFDYSLKC